MPNGGPTSKDAGSGKSKMKGATTLKVFYESKRWNTSCTDDGWSGKLVGLEWNESDGHVEEKWKWTPPPAKGKAKAKDKATANGNGNGQVKKKPMAGKPSQPKKKDMAKAKAKAKGRGGN